MKHTLLTLSFVFLAIGVFAQSPLEWDDFVADIYDEMGEDESAAEALLLSLDELRQHPIDLNTATDDDLRQLPFLSDNQIKDILFYRERNGSLLSLGELMLVRGIDAVTRSRLSLFCRIDSEASSGSHSPTLRHLLSNIEHDLVVRTDIPLYTRAGYRAYPDSVLSSSPNKIYLGNNNYHSIRYSLASMNRLYAGLQIEKDGGEDAFDYVSAYIQLKNNRGLLRNVIIGDFRVGFAQGLVINTNLSFGKLASLGSTAGSNRGFTRHSSMMEANHFRGIALTLKPADRITLNAFFSYNDIDGTYRTDTVGFLSSIKTDGLHRTQLERSKRHNLTETTFGGNIIYATSRLQLGATAVHSHLSVPLLPKSDTPSTLYRLYNPSGTDFTNVSASYGVALGQLTLQGETATSADGGIATFNTVDYSLNSITHLTFSQRHYSKRYTALHASSFGEGSSVQNESGLCLAFRCQPLSHLTAQVYVDAFRFPWLRYQASESSNGFDIVGQLHYQPSDRTTWQLRYRLKSKQKDVKLADDDISLYYYTTQQVRLQQSQTISPRTTLRSVASLNIAFHPISGNSVGYGVSSLLRWKPSIHRKHHFDLALAYFHTDDYDSRIYATEPSLLYAMNITNYAYHGLRAALLLSVQPLSRLTLNAKVSATKYFNRDTIGTAQELIDSSHREDIQLQLHYQL